MPLDRLPFAPTGPTIQLTATTTGATASISGFPNTPDATVRVLHADDMGHAPVWVNWGAPGLTPSQDGIPLMGGDVGYFSVGTGQPTVVGATCSTSSHLVMFTPGRYGG